MENQLTVKELKEEIKDLPDNMKIYVVSDDDIPVRLVTGVEWETKIGYYSELYLNTVECKK